MDKDKYIGRLLDGRYEILEVLGVGGMAVVYKARCHRLNRMVAVKILKDEFSQDEEFRRRFHAESQAVAMLSHPNIVSVYDVSSTGDADFIVMEVIDGITLKEYMEKKGVLNWKETLHFAIQIAKALEHAHSRGIVHRDIKPHNVMVLKNGSLKVNDFGIAQITSKSTTLTKEALGSVHYISPEQAKGGRVDNRSDIYSLGIVMYEMISGRVPYDGDSPVSVAIQHINGGAVKPSHWNPNVPVGLEQIIARAMALLPGDRYSSATEMLYDMDEFRKEPDKVFAEPTAVDGATRPLPKDLKEELGTSRTSDTGKTTVDTKSGKGSKSPEPEGRSRLTTVAIASCAVVGIVAVIIFLVIMAQGGLGKQKVEVPYLVGEYYDDLNAYSGIEVVLLHSDYSKEYAEGQIMEQSPAAGEKVDFGYRVFVTVSLGDTPPAKTMEDLTGENGGAAEKFLNALKMKLNVVILKETSETVKVGYVTRTSPAAGQPLTEGQTVTLWVSKAPEAKLEKMLDAVGKTYEAAERILKANGFLTIERNPVDSELPKEQVVAQRDEKGNILEVGSMVDVTTKIILDVSTGVSQMPIEPSDPSEPADTTKPTETPPTTPDGMQTLEYAFIIPSRTESYQLSIKAGGEWLLENMTIQPGANSVRIMLTGSGTQMYELYINGVYYTTETVEFDPNE